MFLSVFCVSHLHEEPRQQGPLDVQGVGLGAEGGLRDGELYPTQDVPQLRPQRLGRLQGRGVEEVVPAPAFNIKV